MHPPHNAYLQKAIEWCWRCRHHCQETLFNEYLIMNGPVVMAPHVTVIIETIQICQLAADFMTRNSLHYEAVVRACAEICDDCADHCLETPVFTQCAELCKQTAEACRGALRQLGEAGA